MLEGAAFALLRSQIKEREDAAHATALKELQHERDEVAKLRGEYEVTHAAAERRLTEVKAYRARVRKRVKQAIQAADQYRKAVEEIRERLDELISAADSFGISNELEAIVAMIDEVSRKDPDFQAEG
jgi:hypothetical protein